MIHPFKRLVLAFLMSNFVQFNGILMQKGCMSILLQHLRANNAKKLLLAISDFLLPGL